MVEWARIDAKLFKFSLFLQYLLIFIVLKNSKFALKNT